MPGSCSDQQMLGDGEDVKIKFRHRGLQCGTTRGDMQASAGNAVADVPRRWRCQRHVPAEVQHQ